MSGHAKPREALLPGCAFGTLVLLAGCGQTLVFGERDGVNLAIRADAKTQPPLEVNFGLNRTVGTIIPPAGQTDGRPEGEAVNMFAGFQIERWSDIAPTKPVAVDLRIASQFASGAAANKVAGNPVVVKQIVNVNLPIVTAVAPDFQIKKEAVATFVKTLPPEDASKLATALGQLPSDDRLPILYLIGQATTPGQLNVVTSKIKELFGKEF